MSAKRIIAAMCAAATFFVSAAVYAEGVPLKKYDENFEYASEIMPYALKATVCNMLIYVTGELKYNQPSIDDKKLANAVNAYVNADSSATLDGFLDWIAEKPDLIITSGGVQTVSLNKVLYSSGSGVVISENGYIATNQHVVEIDEDEVFATVFGNSLMDDLEGVLEEFSEAFGGSVEITEERAEKLFECICNWSVNRVQMSDVTVDYEAAFPDADGKASDDTAIRYTAEVIREGSADDAREAEDCAIVKIDAYDIPALSFDEEYPEVGEKIWAAGFPGMSDKFNPEASKFDVTVTDGQVSRLETFANQQYKLIQTTARISHGNSGGPSVNSRLKITGLNTLGVAEEGNYQWMVATELIADKAEGLSVGLRDTSKTFLLGLQAMQNGYGKTALDCFEAVKSIQPDTPCINELITKAEGMPQKSMGFVLDKNVIILVAAMGAVALLAIIISLAATKKRKPTPTPRYDSGWDTETFGSGDDDIFSITSGEDLL